MTTLTLHTESLRCDASTRTVTGLALPYGEPGRTSLGLVTASQGSGVQVGERVTGNLEHDPKSPLGRMVSSEDTDAGVVMTFKIANTSKGNDLLAEIEDGLRTGMSVEVDDPIIRDGALLGGTISAVGFVTRPAFPSAQVTMAASDTGEVQDEDETPEDEAEAEQVEAESDTTESEISDEDTEEEEDKTVTATATASLAASAASVKSTTTITTVQEFAERLTAARNSGDHQMLAALADITQSGVGADIAQAQFLGELWSGKAYNRVVVPLVQGGSLTSYKVEGWRWTTKPEVAAYAGNKGAVTSNQPDTEAAHADVVRLAGAHDFDRKFADFGDTAFLTSYMQAMTESYARKTDAALVEFLQFIATDTEAGTVPSGVSAAAAAIVDGALAVLDKGVPTFALVAPDMWRQLLLTPKDQTLEYLSMSLGLEEGTVKNFKIVPRTDLDAGAVLVGISGAVQFFELPGVPIRVDAINIANGGLDQGLFGYYALMEHDSAGISMVGGTPGS